MYKEMDASGQYQLDCRLTSERTLEENVNVMIGFTCDLRRKEDWSKKVQNRHEGYGFLAKDYLAVQKAMKNVKDGMSDLLNNLPASNDSAAVDKVETLANALADAIVATANMAAEAKRVSNDLYDEAWSTSSDADADGFAEPESE